MHRIKFVTTIFMVLLISINVNAKKKPKVDEVLIIQKEVNQAYRLGYVDASPIEMSKIEQKLEKARIARDKRRKKDLYRLIEELKVDLKIVKKRHDVNKKQEELNKAQAENTENKRLLDELKAQL